ncbi:MAG TPA: flavin reductase family protein [Xanthobacteraceae bacterium]|nr:flavin reductase family protein [Xanthobacteraceae bacterium]
MSDDRQFRFALGEFATGVAVITARSKSGELIGMTMSSFNSVSLDPPLILFSVDRKALSLPAMEEAEGYAVNVLAKHQASIANQFARRMADKWSDIERTVGHAEAPLINGALAHFECTPYATYDGGDHVIFVGRVVRYATHPQKPAPLVFFRGRYQNLTPADEPAYDWPLPMHY